MTETTESLRVPARWTDDCQGKKDYDAALVSLSTRYWPRGGGYHVLTADREWMGNESRPEVRPHAHAAIVLRHGDGDTIMLTEADFEADTPEEVQRAVEAWAQREYERVTAAVRALYVPPPESERA